MSAPSKPGKTIRAPGWLLLIAAVLIVRPITGRFLGSISLAGAAIWASITLWCLFSLYWSAAAKNASMARKSESRDSRRWHVFLVNAGLLLILIPLPGLRQRFLPASPILAGVGLGLQIASGFLGVWARKHLGSNWSGEITIKVNHSLIRTGPYRRIRHPIYTAMLGMFVGTVLVSAELHALVGLALAVFAYWRKIQLEEANLEEAFGPAYGNYRAASWALIPGLF